MNQVDLSGRRDSGMSPGLDPKPTNGCPPGRRRAINCRRRGFTLIELLVTVTIVIALAGLLSVGLRSMKHSAESSKCMANVKNLCVAAVTASADNNGKYPAMKVYPWDPDTYLSNTGSGFYSEQRAGSIGEVLGPYLGLEPESSLDVDAKSMPEVFQCPAALRNTRKAWINRYGAYRFNYYAIGRSPAPPGAMIFIDACWNDWPKEDFSHQKPVGLNVGYADGHVAFMSHAAYMKVNPISSAEKNNRFFTKGWLQ